MKTINNFIHEKLKIRVKQHVYNYHPKSKDELRDILEERLASDKNANLNDIDVSGIDNMAWLFENLDPHNIDISEWDVSNVEFMGGMFYQCSNFNCDLSDWNVSKVTNMLKMFYECENFNCDLSDWDVSKVEDMRWMFQGCKKFKCNLNTWNVNIYGYFIKDMFKYSGISRKKPSWYEQW